jgi:hypothetical protein
MLICYLKQGVPFKYIKFNEPIFSLIADFDQYFFLNFSAIFIS